MPCLSAYFNRYQILRVLLWKGIRGWNEGEVAKNCMYKFRKPLAQAPAPPLKKINKYSQGWLSLELII